MRILIYIEPFPLRQKMDHNRDQAAAFAKMLVSESAAERMSEFDIRIYASRDSVGYAQDQVLAAKRFLLTPESREQDQFRASLTEWPHEGVQTWTNLMIGNGSVTREYQSVFEQIHNRFPFDVVLTIGENGAAKAFAAAANLDHIVLDLSLDHPGVFGAAMFDPGGAGGASLLAQLNAAQLKSIVKTDPWPAILDQSCVSQLYAPSLEKDAKGPIDFTGQVEILSQGNARTALISLQNFDDPGMCAHSSFTSPAHLLETCLPQLADHNIRAIVRPPAAGSEGPGQAEAMALARQVTAGFGDKALWLSRHNENVSDTRLYTLCDLVVTVNGPAGIDAALFDTQISVLGNAAYKPVGLFPKFEAALSRKFDSRTYLKNLAAMRTFMMRTQFVRANQAFEFNTFSDRLAQTLSAWHDSNRDPQKAAAQLYEHYEPQAAAGLKASIDSREPQTPRIAAPAAPPQEPERASWATLNKSVSRLTSRARETLERKILQSKLKIPTGTGPIESNRLFGPVLESLGEAPPPQPHYPLNDEEQQSISKALATLEKQRKSRARFAVVARCFYLDTTHHIIDRLKQVEQKFDLVVTVPPYGTAELKDTVRQAFPTAKVIPLPDRGRDIWPLSFIAQELNTDKYDTVLKLNTTKPHFETKDLDETLDEAWTEYALTCLLGPPGDASRIDAILDPETPWAMAGPEGLVQSTQNLTLDLDYDPNPALAALNTSEVPHVWPLFAGGNYWIKLETVKDIGAAFAAPDAYPTGAFATDCQHSTLGQHVLAIAAVQTGHQIAALSPDPGVSAVDAQPPTQPLDATLREFRQRPVTS